MKKQLLTLAFILLVTHLYAQKIEVSAEANSGLFSYAGKSTTANSQIIESTDINGNNANYTNNPYGNKQTFSYEFAIQTQYVTKSGFIFGLQTGYDILRSKTNINGVYPTRYYLAFVDYYSIYIPGPDPATGTSYLQDKFINLAPYLGYRLNYKHVKVDILPGVDIGLNINSYDKGKATATNGGIVYETDLKRLKTPTDVRLKLGLAGYYKRFGLNVSYAYGLTNYEQNVIGDATYDAKSRLLRFGLSYRLL